MSKFKEAQAKAKRSSVRAGQRAARLSRSTIPPSVKKALASCLASPSEEELDDVVVELTTYRGPNAAYRQSNRYYYAALAKVYEIWRRIDAWSPEARRHLLARLDEENRRQMTYQRASGSDLHVLLRFLIHHESDQKAEQRLRSRDAAALRQVARNGWTPKEFLSRAESGAVGLDRLHREDVKARRLERQSTVAAREVPAVPAETSVQVASNVNDEQTDDARIVWRGLSKNALLEAVKTPHDVVLIGRLDPHEKKIILRRAYRTEYITHSTEELREVVQTMRDAGLIKANRVGRRSKV